MFGNQGRTPVTDRTALRVVIVDDEPLARAVVREYAGRSGREIVADCANGFEAVKAVAELRPDRCCSMSRCRN